MYDIAIIGGGIAGITAAIFAVRRKQKVILISRDMGGQLINVTDIENWPGEKRLSGVELINKLINHLHDYQVETKFTTVEGIAKNPDSFNVKFSSENIEAKSVILCFGKSPTKLNVKGEDEFLGKGVSYCVNCDGNFFKNKHVAVIGGGSSALEGALTLANICNKVYLIHRRDSFRAESVLTDKVVSNQKIEIIYNSAITEILGDSKVNAINVDSGKNIALDGVFVEIGHSTDTSIIKELVDIDENNHVVINQDGSTSTKGIFAAGDITNHPFKQLIIASGQGATAALSAVKYLQNS